MSEDFSPFQTAQKESHCGPCSLSYGLFILGINATQTEVAKASGASLWTRYRKGLNESLLKKAANHYGVTLVEVLEAHKEKGGDYLKTVKSHLAKGYPVVWATYDGGHWEALLGLDEKTGRIIECDPDADEDDDPLFHKMSDAEFLKRSWCDFDEDDEDGDDDDEEPSQYYALLVTPKDARAPSFRLTNDLLLLHNRGSGEELRIMIKDIHEIVSPLPQSDGKSVSFESLEDIISENAWNWVAYDSDVESVSEVRQQYKDYIIVAQAMGLRGIPDNTKSIAGFSSVMGSLLTTFIWNDGDLEGAD